MRISDWSSDVCSSDLQITFIHWRNGPSHLGNRFATLPKRVQSGAAAHSFGNLAQRGFKLAQAGHFVSDLRHYAALTAVMSIPALNSREGTALRSEEHTSELQSLMRISYAVFCLKKKKTN